MNKLFIAALAVILVFVATLLSCERANRRELERQRAAEVRTMVQRALQAVYGLGFEDGYRAAIRSAAAVQAEAAASAADALQTLASTERQNRIDRLWAEARADCYRRNGSSAQYVCY